MRVTLPADLTGKALIKYLVKNKAQLIKQKSSMSIKSDDFGFNTEILEFKKNPNASKAAGSVDDMEAGELNVKVICNTALWCDSHMDVLLPDCWKKTIKEMGPKGADRIYHLHDHQQNTKGIIGYPSDLYSQEYLLSDLGLGTYGMGSTQCLIMESTVKESLDDTCFQLYKDKKVKQHSIGLQYIKLDLCIADKEYASAQEYENWLKYYPVVINKDKIDSYGYFWIVPEIKLYENSAVLFGSNEVTFTIDDDNTDSKTIQPDTSTGTDNEPDTSTQKRSVSEMIAARKIIIHV